ncbi:MAG: hypothetical protein A2Y10_19040 [Planctomycetes bacterium GWF2_41_51]|nr:MAG: hypothetical protein A2Y10_19040 [Planctomycetes bacterium GWF2_41_51]HBG27401.1 hypothetical protein [Phycisphaerales bacterium]
MEDNKRMIKLIAVILTCTSALSAANYNVFDQLYPGTRNNFNGRVGFSFRTKTPFEITALGRPVNPAYNGGVLQAAHTIELFRVSGGALVASAVISSSSPKDSFGYAYETLAVPVTLVSNTEYMILSDETAGDGDPWLDLSFITGYRDDLISIRNQIYTGTHAGNIMPPPAYGNLNYLYVPPTFYTTIPDPTPPVVMWEDFSFSSSFDGTSPLWARAFYPVNADNAPMMVVQHGYESTRGAVMYSMERMARNGYFCVAVDYRGWDGSAGTHDDGGLEIMDIYDAIQETRRRYPGKVDPNLTSIIGYSNGGGNVFFSTIRFPFTFRASMALFGIPDYGQWATLVSNWRDKVYAAVGGTPAQVPDKYFVRRAEEAATNLSGTHFHIAYDQSEWMCPIIMDTEFIAAVPSQQQDNVFLHVSKTTDTYRWTHGHNTTGHLNVIEDLFMADMSNNNLKTPTMPANGNLVVLGFIVTPKFKCFLGSGDDAAASVEYHFQDDRASFDFSALTSDNTRTGTLILEPNTADYDLQVCINGTQTAIIEQRHNLQFNFPIESSVEIRPYTPADISCDCQINFKDIALLAERWLDQCNTQNQWCDGVDVNKSESVEFGDLSIIAETWLK